MTPRLGLYLDLPGGIVKHNFDILYEINQKIQSWETCLAVFRFALASSMESELKPGTCRLFRTGRFLNAAYALDHPRFGPGPTPSLMVTSRLAGICLKVSCSPLGQYTSMSAEVE